MAPQANANQIDPFYILKAYGVYESAVMPEGKRDLRTGDKEEGPAEKPVHVGQRKEKKK